MSSQLVQWAVRNDAGKVWTYASASAAERSRATSEMLVRSIDGKPWEYVWSGPETAPEALLHG